MNADAAARRSRIRSLRDAINSFVKLYCDEADEIVYADGQGDMMWCPKCGAESHLTVHAENMRVLALLLPMHKGGLHGEDSQGIADIEFPTLRHAAGFVETLADPKSARLRDAQVRFDRPVVVQVPVSRETRLFPSAREIYRGR